MHLKVPIKALGTALEVLKGLEVRELGVLEDYAIFDLRSQGPSRRVISVMALRESQFGPYLTMGRSTDLIFPQNNTEIKYKLNYPRTLMCFFFFFSTHKSSDYPSSAKLKQKLKITLVLLNYA